MVEVATLCTVTVLSCCCAVTLVNTLFSGYGSCPSFSGRVMVEFKAIGVSLYKLRLSISMNHLSLDFGRRFAR